MADNDKTTSDRQKEMDAGKEAVMKAYNDLLEAQGHFRQAAEAAGLDLKHDAMQQLLAGKEKADALGQEVQRYVREKPVATLGLAFLAGLLFSHLVSRK